ncbi:hypothetical protein RG47T_4240 [Mucilaginibacter polytrichastri]|uniref:Uncharacterized protein n=1 Tax=Mucilaginibacter polytrichastri TaxID=1302689 RepID=A0A1Q6A434_9SPHI|nr:hypothetical protein RG47T_4240 [Mucilaginibacter polytrichastri]
MQAAHTFFQKYKPQAVENLSIADHAGFYKPYPANIKALMGYSQIAF